MLSRPVIEFTQIRAVMKQWLTLPGSSCKESSRLFTFSSSTFSKSSFCYEQAVGQRHQSQCPSHCHSCALAEHGEKYPYQPLRHGTVPQQKGLRSPRVCVCSPDPVAESASKCFGFALWHKEFDDFSLFVLALIGSFHDFTV